MEIKLPNVSDMPKSGTKLIRWIIKKSALVLIGFSMIGMIMKLIPILPKLWGTPQDFALSLIAFTLVYLAMWYIGENEKTG